MRIAVFQFGSSEHIHCNLAAIKRAVAQAAEKNARLLVFHECAACGYPPVETDMRAIDFHVLNTSIAEVQKLAKEHAMYIALGTIRKEDEKYFNSIVLIDDHGEMMGHYDKRALWGWDLDHFSKGNSLGIFEIDNTRIGFRICFEIRFPEYFREMFKAKADLCFVSFCDVAEQDSLDRYEMIKSHLKTRAVENVMTVVSVNSISNFQTAPTAVFDINGKIAEETPKNIEYLLVYDYASPEMGFGARGRIQNSLDVLGLSAGI